ncbi:MAG: hypothetical protein R8G34_07620 [Paracoccaceae bacterium]|nr:hypothetical protein [Paracoccaceae bacterium]
MAVLLSQRQKKSNIIGRNNKNRHWRSRSERRESPALSEFATRVVKVRYRKFASKTMGLLWAACRHLAAGSRRGFAASLLLHRRKSDVSPT